jgi:hypothetical protein
MSEEISHEELIRKFPALLEIEESIRQHVLDVFSETENGTPDNISKAGCLALALKSNDAGQPRKGYVIWNAWRKAFPVIENQPDYNFANGSNFSLKIPVVNYTDFSSIDFEARDYSIFRYLDFSGFHFGSKADFSNVRKKTAIFESAVFGDNVNFENSEWGEKSRFSYAQWGINACFQATQWGQWAEFRCAAWGAFSKFQAAQWGYGANFYGATWNTNAEFNGAQWGNNCNFQGTTWLGKTDFSALPWAALRQFYQDDKNWSQARQWAEFHGLSPEGFQTVDFSGACFDEVTFSNRRFLGKTSFAKLPDGYSQLDFLRDHRGRQRYNTLGELSSAKPPLPNQLHTSFAHAPQFHGCELHQDTSFDDAVFPPDIGKTEGNEDATRAYRTLKLAFSKQQAIRQEQRFFKLEMEEETLRETGLKRWLFKAYKTFSDYGFSTMRPLKYWGLGVLVFTTLYGLLSWLGQCHWNMGTCHFAPQWLEFSLLQTLPLPGLDKLSEAARAAFWPEGAWWGLALSVLVILHKTISLAALFLVGLALRNLFKLK